MGARIDSLSLIETSPWQELQQATRQREHEWRTMAPLPPGSPLAERQEPDRTSRNHFAMVTAKVLSIDWLELHAEGHRRAHFGPDRTVWLQP